MRVPVFFIFVLMLTACGEQTTPVNEPPATTVTEPVAVPDEEQPEPVVDRTKYPVGLEDLAMVPKHWTQLKTENGEQVIYMPCLTEPNSLVIAEAENSVWEMELFVQDDLYDFKVLEASVEADDVKDGQPYRTNFLLAGTEGDQFKATLWYDPGTGIGKWDNVHDKFDGKPMVPDVQSSFFPLVEQPCLECWEERCNHELAFHEAYGDGMLMVKNTANITIALYDTVGGTLSKTIRIINEQIADPAMAEYVYPHVKKLDYNLLHFVCMNVSENWFEIQVGPGGETFWVQQSPDLEYLKWPEYLLQAMAIERVDALYNPIKRRPGQNGSVIAYENEYDCFRPVKVVGKWVLVEYHEVLCNEQERAGFQNGWFKWRDDDDLLVRLSWMM